MKIRVGPRPQPGLGPLGRAINPRYVNGQVVIAKWPRKKKLRPTPYDLYKQLEFGVAARWAAHADALTYETARLWVEGTTMVPRDFIVGAIYGKSYVLELEDGTKSVPYREMTPNAQQVLDLVTDVTGSLLYRSPTGWVGIPPGNLNDVLTMRFENNHQKPKWKGAQSVQVGGVASWGAEPNATSASAFCCKGYRCFMNASAVVMGYQARVAETNANDYCITIYRTTSYTDLHIAEVMGSSEIATAASTATRDRMFAFLNPIELVKGQHYVFGHRRLSAAANSSSGIFSQNDDPYGWPCLRNSEGAHIANLAPGVGDLFLTDANAWSATIVGGITAV